MMSDRTTHLACPTCGRGLMERPGIYSCANGHSFDIARAGYVNLLQRRKKLSPTVGDSREMLTARERFLDGGHFTPLTAALDDLVATTLNAHDGSPRAVVEVGSGTGHHIGHFAETEKPGLTFFGFDISKEAVKFAARRHTGVTFGVADVKRGVPITDGAALVVLDVFSPRNPLEFARVLGPDGLLVVVVPAPDHLARLVERFGLLTIPPDKVRDVVGEMNAHFRLDETVEVRFEMPLSEGETLDLIAMGPSARHVDLRRIEEELEGGVTAKASMVLLGLRRH